VVFQTFPYALYYVFRHYSLFRSIRLFRPLKKITSIPILSIGFYWKRERKNSLCRRRSGGSTWPCHPDLSGAARPAEPVAMPCQQNREYVDDRYRRSNIRMAWRLRVAGRRSRLAAVGLPPSTPYPGAHRPPVMATASRCDCWTHRRDSTSSCHLSVSVTKLQTFVDLSKIWSVRARFIQVDIQKKYCYA